MRKLYVFNMTTVDGLFEGPNKWDIGWHNVDEEFNEFAINQLNATDLILFGRVTYEGMASYWPTPDAIKNDLEVANKMNSIAKIVFSKTLEKADWNNTRLIKKNIAEEVMVLKQQPGKDLALFGSANLMSTFVQNGLIDEYRIIVNPVVLGKGTPLFGGISDKFTLELLQARTFKNGNVLLRYKPVER